MIVVSDVIQTEPYAGSRHGNSTVSDPYNGPHYVSVCLAVMIRRLTFRLHSVQYSLAAHLSVSDRLLKPYPCLDTAI